MTNEMVKFTAEVAKGISVGTKDVTIKLLIPLAAVESRLSSLAKLQEKEVMVYLGDPQAAFDFEDEDDRDPMYNTWNGGRRVTTDASGVVTSIDGPKEEEKDENQAELFDGEGKPLNQQEPNGAGDDQGGEASEGKPDSEGHPPISEDGTGEPSLDDVPDWMREEGGDKSGAPEMDFDGQDQDGQQPDEEGQPDPEGKNEDSDNRSDGNTESFEIDQDKLNQYIITNRPVIAEITLDVPAVIERKLQDTSLTWRDIAKDMGMTSGKLMGVVSKYRAKVKEEMASSGVA